MRPRDVRDELTMKDFLREYLGMTGVKFGRGAAQCLSCAIIESRAIQCGRRLLHYGISSPLMIAQGH